MSLKDLLVICPSHRDRRELERIAPDSGLRLHFHDYASIELENLAAALPAETLIRLPSAEIADILRRFGRLKLAGVITTDDYPGSAMAAIVARHLGLPGISAAASLRCQHKYLSRLDQQRLVPEAVPAFSLLDCRFPQARRLQYPLFVKPVKSFFSIGASRVDGPAHLEAAVAGAKFPAEFYRPFEDLLRMHPEVGLAEMGSHCVIAESVLRGRQCTLEGFVRRGVARIVGVVDSIFYPGTSAFQRFEYPSSLPQALLERLHRISARLMEGLAYGDGFFNIEFMVDPDDASAYIIEVNPRPASQFADLYEKVDGTNSYRTMLDLALGRTPGRRKGAGRHRMAASCALRVFDDAYVRALPSARSLRRLHARHPDLRVEVLVNEAEWLSGSLQDGRSFRYAVVNIGGGDRAEILRILDECVAELAFDFEGARVTSTNRRTNSG